MTKFWDDMFQGIKRSKDREQMALKTPYNDTENTIQKQWSRPLGFISSSKTQQGYSGFFDSLWSGIKSVGSGIWSGMQQIPKIGKKIIDFVSPIGRFAAPIVSMLNPTLGAALDAGTGIAERAGALMGDMDLDKGISDEQIQRGRDLIREGKGEWDMGRRYINDQNKRKRPLFDMAMPTLENVAHTAQELNKRRKLNEAPKKRK